MWGRNPWHQGRTPKFENRSSLREMIFSLTQQQWSTLKAKKQLNFINQWNMMFSSLLNHLKLWVNSANLLVAVASKIILSLIPKWPIWEAKPPKKAYPCIYYPINIRKYLKGSQYTTKKTTKQFSCQGEKGCLRHPRWQEK